MIEPNRVLSICNNLRNLFLKACATMTSTSDAICPLVSRLVISGQSGLHIMVMKYNGHLNSLASARLSAVCSDAHFLDLIKLASNLIFTLLRSIDSFSSCALVSRPLQMNSNLSSSILEYISQRYSEHSLPNIKNLSSCRIRPLYHSRCVNPVTFIMWLWWSGVEDNTKPQPHVPWGNNNGYCKAS